MKHLAYICAIALMIMVGAPSAKAEGVDLWSLSLGAYDINDDDTAVDARIEYRPHSPIFIDELRPWLGAEATSDASFWAGGGLLLDVQLTQDVYVTPSVGVGLYAQGSSDKDLGHVIEFRSQLEIAYEFDNNNRLGVAFGHLSNASLDDRNPGTEVLSLYWHIPFGEIF